MTSRAKPWTTRELKTAADLWKEGKSIETIATALGRGRESVKHQTQVRRDLFPRRKQERMSIKDVVTTKMVISKFVYRRIKSEATERGISINMVIREALVDRFVRNGNRTETHRPGK